MKKFSFQLSEEQYQKLRQTALDKDVSMASLCREALGRHLLLLEQEAVDLETFFASFGSWVREDSNDTEPVNRSRHRAKPGARVFSFSYSANPDEDELMEIWLR